MEQQTLEQLKAENQLLRNKYEGVIHKLKDITRLIQSMTGTSGSGPEETNLLKSILQKNSKNTIKKQKRKDKKLKHQQEAKIDPVIDLSWAERYNHPLWKKRAQQIKRRDGFKCITCGSSHNLHVHHLLYQSGFQVWEYGGDYLITLCASCHEKEHAIRDIKSFINTGIPIPKYKLLTI